MPRAAPIANPPNPNALKRNQACHQCRKRKLKCDALLPCGPCSRSHAHAFKLNPNTAPQEPECTYDNPEEIAEGPKGKIARLEAQVAELQEALRLKEADLALCTCGRQGQPSLPASITTTPPLSGPSTLTSSPPLASVAEVLDATRSLPLVSSSPIIPPPPGYGAPVEEMASIENTWTQIEPPGRIFSTPAAPALLSPPLPETMLTFNNWPLNIPTPDLLYHLVETFFNCVPLATRVLHRPTFMVNLKQVPTHPDFPHVALLHSICAIASLYTPVITYKKKPDLRGNVPTAQFHSGILYRAEGNVSGDRFLPRRMEDILKIEDDSFGALHVRWCSAAFRMAIQEGDRLIQLLQSAIICAWYSYTTGQSVNTFSWIGLACRMALPLGLSASAGYEPLSRLPPQMLSLMQPPKSAVEAEAPRNLFWLVYSLERILTAGTVWPLTLVDDDISQIMPCRLADFTSAAWVPALGRQRLFTPKVFVTHPPLLTDSFVLYAKAASLVGKVKTFNVRFKMRYTDGDGYPANTQQSPGGTKYPYGEPSSTAASKLDPRETVEFQMLDNMIQTFPASIPKEFKDPVGVDGVGTKVDPVLYIAHMLPYVAKIMLHDPHADPTSPNCFSTVQILFAARAILDLIYKICATTYDLIYLDHSCSFCWFIAGAALIRCLKGRMDSGDDEEVTRMTQELGVIRFMLSNLGERTIIGLRQIKLLDDIYNIEIKGIRMMFGLRPPS